MSGVLDTRGARELGVGNDLIQGTLCEDGEFDEDVEDCGTFLGIARPKTHNQVRKLFWTRLRVVGERGTKALVDGLAYRGDIDHSKAV